VIETGYVIEASMLVLLTEMPCSVPLCSVQFPGSSAPRAAGGGGGGGGGGGVASRAFQQAMPRQQAPSR